MTGLPLGPKKYLPARITIDGNTLDTVGVRQKGFFSNWGAFGSYKKPLKVDINEFVSGQKYDGLKKFNLQNGFGDPSVMRDMLSYDLMRRTGAAAPRSAYAGVYLNQKYWGLYLMVEQVDKTFLDNNFSSKQGNLYKAISSCHLDWQGTNPENYKDELELKTNEAEDDWSDMIRLLRILSFSSANNFVDSIDAIFEVEEFLKILAIDVMLYNWDSYYDHGRNFYLYQNPDTRKFHWIPWDYNLSFSYTQVDILFKDLRNQGGWNKPLIESILAVDSFETMFLESYCEALSGNFDSTRMFPLIDQTATKIRPFLAIDTNYFYSINDFDLCLHSDIMGSPGPIGFPAPGLKPFVRDRILTVRQELGSWGHLCQPSVGIDDPITQMGVTLYPNPAQDAFRIDIEKPLVNGQVLLRNQLGQLIMSRSITGLSTEVTVRDLPTGLYIAEVVGEGVRMSRKVVVK